MQNRNEPKKLSFTITSAMSNKEISEKVTAAAKYFSEQSYSNAKKQVLESCTDYAQNSLAKGLFNKDDSRYKIYSNIVNFADHLDDLHFLHYAVQQLSQISQYDNSTFRRNTLPIATMHREALLTPMIARSEKAFMGMVAFGMATLISRVAPMESTVCMGFGLIGYLGSSNIVRKRLDRSLALKFSHLLTNGSNNTGLIADGMSDEFGTFERVATGMLENGLHLFNRAGGQFARMARLGQGQQNLAIEGANVATNTEEVKEKVMVLK